MPNHCGDICSRCRSGIATEYSDQGDWWFCPSCAKDLRNMKRRIDMEVLMIDLGAWLLRRFPWLRRVVR